jgi:flagellar assembly protein FliH
LSRNRSGYASGGRPVAAADLEARLRESVEKGRRFSRALIEEVAREADALARRRLEEAFARGREEGFAHGFREGREAGQRGALSEKREEFARAVAALEEAARGVAEARETVRAEAEAGLVLLATEIAAKLASQALELTPGSAREALHEAIRLTTDRVEVRLQVSQADRASLEAMRDELREEFPEIIRIAVEPSAEVSPGGCRVVTASSTVDATIEARAARIARILLGREERAA